MTQIQILFSLLLLFSCKQEQKGMIFIPLEYQYPLDSLNQPRTFIYENLNKSEREFADLSIEVKSNQKYLCSRRYTLTETFDSTITLDGKIVESFILDPFTKVLNKADLQRDTVLKTEKKYGQRVRDLTLRGNDYTTIQNYKVEYLKDTSILWKGKDTDCIVMKGFLRTDFLSNHNTDKGQFLSTHYSYFAKNIGTIRYTTEFEDKRYTFSLIDIILRK